MNTNAESDLQNLGSQDLVHVTAVSQPANSSSPGLAAVDFAQDPGMVPPAVSGDAAGPDAVDEMSGQPTWGSETNGDCAMGLAEAVLSDREQEWRRLAREWDEMKRQGRSRADAARLLGCGAVTLWRVERQYAARGFKHQMENCGRSSDWDYLVERGAGVLERKKRKETSDDVAMTPEEAFCLKLVDIYLATIGASGGNVVRGRRTARMATALTCMAEEPECPKELASRLKRGRFPRCLQRFLKRITPELENRFRGPKHFQLNGITSRRDLTLRFPDGTRGELPAGFKWVFDDMSANQPFFASLPEQMLFSRQGLYSIDHRALKWLGKMLVARPREAYRADDILRFCRHLFEVYGKPDVIVLEKSVWASRKIRGYKATGVACGAAVEEEEFVRPEMAKSERSLLSQGLGAIGVKIIYAISARGKIIEGCFNHLQAVLAIMTRDFNNIGRYGGEFETAAKRLRQVRAGSRGPEAVGFAPMNELSDRIDRAFAHINSKTNSRGEVPNDVWAQACGVRNEDATWLVTGRRPLRDLEQNDYAVFLPDVRERKIDGGMVTVEVKGRPYDFRAPWMLELGSGYQVFVKFDSSEPMLGAAIYNRQGGTANFKNHRFMEFLGWAAWEMPAPSVDVTGAVRGVESKSIEEIYGAGAFDNGDNLRRQQNKVVARVFSALPRPGQPAVKRADALDQAGRVTKIESGGKQAGTAAAVKETRPGRGILVAPTADEVTRRREKLSKRAELARQLIAINA